MKKVLKYGALAGVLALASCSEEEVQRVVTDADQIRYSSEVAAISRAADSYCNLDKPTEFNIWAFNEDGSLYINNDRIVSNDLGNTYINASGVRYWPVDEKGDANADLDFFAARNHGTTLTFTETVGYKNVPGFKDFTIKDGVTEQVDLIYAAAMGKNKGDETVNFNFRHALSQICFRALNHTTNLDIAIKGVKIGHLSNKGDFTFPVDTETGKPQDTHDTAVEQEVSATNPSHPGNWVDGDHNDLPGNYENQQLDWQGIWANRSEALKGMTSADAYAVTPLGAAYTYGEATYTAVPRTDKTTRDYTNLTCPGKNHVNGFDQVLTLLPQTMVAWNPEQHAAEYNGAYFILDAVLENVTTDAEGNQVKTQVYKGNIAVPVDVEWYPGFRYIYTFIFDDEHNGGWTDDPENPQPVLNPVKYDVTVDDFIPVEAGDHFIGGGDANNTNSSIINFFDGALGKNIVKSYSSDVVAGIGNYNGGTPYALITFDDDLDSYAPEKEGYHFIGWGHWDGKTEPTQVIVKPGQKTGAYYIGYTYNFAPMYEADEEQLGGDAQIWPMNTDGSKVATGRPDGAIGSNIAVTWVGTAKGTFELDDEMVSRYTYDVPAGYTLSDLRGWSTTLGGELAYEVGGVIELSNGDVIHLYPVWKKSAPALPAVTVEWYSADGGKYFMSHSVKPDNGHIVEIWETDLATYLTEQGKTIDDVLGFSKVIGSKDVVTDKKLFESNGKYLFTYDCSADADNSTVKLYLVFDEAEQQPGNVEAGDYAGGTWTPAN